MVTPTSAQSSSRVHQQGQGAQPNTNKTQVVESGGFLPGLRNLFNRAFGAGSSSGAGPSEVSSSSGAKPTIRALQRPTARIGYALDRQDSTAVLRTYVPKNPSLASLVNLFDLSEKLRQISVPLEEEQEKGKQDFRDACAKLDACLGGKIQNKMILSLSDSARGRECKKKYGINDFHVFNSPLSSSLVENILQDWFLQSVFQQVVWNLHKELMQEERSASDLSFAPFFARMFGFRPEAFLQSKGSFKEQFEQASPAVQALIRAEMAKQISGASVEAYESWNEASKALRPVFLQIREDLSVGSYQGALTQPQTRAIQEVIDLSKSSSDQEKLKQKFLQLDSLSVITSCMEEIVKQQSIQDLKDVDSFGRVGRFVLLGERGPDCSYPESEQWGGLFSQEGWFLALDAMRAVVHFQGPRHFEEAGLSLKDIF